MQLQLQQSNSVLTSFVAIRTVIATIVEVKKCKAFKDCYIAYNNIKPNVFPSTAAEVIAQVIKPICEQESKLHAIGRIRPNKRNF